MLKNAKFFSTRFDEKQFSALAWIFNAQWIALGSAAGGDGVFPLNLFRRAAVAGKDLHGVGGGALVWRKVFAV